MTEPNSVRTPSSAPVLRICDLPRETLQQLLQCFGLQVVLQAEDEDIIGSFWGDEEAGLVRNQLYVRGDTPVHSALHEACHYICMDDSRKKSLHTDAGGDYDEENAVCYLQILLAAALPDMGMARMWSDMDAWGYSFRLGSARSWFDKDAIDAEHWLEKRGLIVRVTSAFWLVLNGVGLVRYATDTAYNASAPNTDD